MLNVNLKLDSSSPTSVLDTVTGGRPAFSTSEAFTVCLDMCDAGVATDPATLAKISICFQRKPSGGGIPTASDPFILTKDVTTFNTGTCLATFQFTSAESVIVDSEIYVTIKAEDTGGNVTTYGADYWCVKLTRRLAEHCKSVTQQLCENGVAMVTRDGAPYFIWKDDTGALKEISLADLVLGKFQIEECLSAPSDDVYNSLSDILNQLSSDNKLCFDNMPSIDSNSCDVTQVALADGKLVKYSAASSQIAFDRETRDPAETVLGAQYEAVTASTNGTFIMNQTVEVPCAGLYEICTEALLNFDTSIPDVIGYIGLKIDGVLQQTTAGFPRVLATFTNYEISSSECNDVQLTAGTHTIQYVLFSSNVPNNAGMKLNANGGFTATIRKSI